MELRKQNMKIFNEIPFSMFSKHSNIRLGAYYELPNLSFPYRSFWSVISSIESGSRPAGGIKDSDIGQAISLGGEQIGADGALNLDKIPYVPMEYYESIDKGKIQNGDILLCKDGALTGKVCQVDSSLLPNASVMANEHIYVIRANDSILQKFLFYLMRTEIFQNQVKDFAFHKKGQPGLNFDHIKAIKIPDIPIEVQESIVNGKTSQIEKQISSLQHDLTQESSIIDNLFAKYFGFDYTRFNKIKMEKRHSINSACFANNPDLRFSAKFHRRAGDYVMNELNRLTSKRIKHFLSEPIILGASISPSDYDNNGDYCYISMATIKSWRFDEESANTVSNSYAESKSAKTVRKNDIILARSGEGTIGKVALITDENLKGIFADFTMRIRLKDYDPEFAYYYFRTTYFQYLIEIFKKGLGNNTNIFPIVIREFPLIDISLPEQYRIVSEIHAEIDKQKNLKSAISDMQQQIDQIVKDTIS